MFLWIRSQDKNWLIPINDIISVFQKRVFYKGIILGQYKSEERALEVLDEIQKLFSLKIVNETYKNADLFIKAAMLPIVYEMPEE